MFCVRVGGSSHLGGARQLHRQVGDVEGGRRAEEAWHEEEEERSFRHGLPRAWQRISNGYEPHCLSLRLRRGEEFQRENGSGLKSSEGSSSRRKAPEDDILPRILVT